MRIYQRNRTWYVDYHVRGKRVRRKIGTKAQAQAVLRKLGADRVQNEWGVAVGPRAVITVQDAAETWLRHKSDNRSIEQDRAKFERLRAILGDDRPILSVGLDMVPEIRDALRAQGLGPSTRNRYMALLRAAQNLLRKLGKIPAVPLLGVQLEREPPPPDRVLSEEEEARLLELATPRQQLVLIWAVDTGARRGEIERALWADLKLDDPAEWYIPDTKSGHPRRLPLTPRLVAELKTWRLRSGTAFRDRVIDISEVFRDWKRLVERAGIPAIRMHDLRHTAATRMRRRGVQQYVISAILGHRSPSMALRYQHFDREDFKVPNAE